MPKKPSGSLGAAIFSHEGFVWNKIAWPIQKSEIEALIFELFLRSLEDKEAKDLGIIGIRQNQENDLDFDVFTNGPTKHIDLVELTPREQFIGDYSAVRSVWTVGEEADLICSTVAKKAAHYGELKNTFLIVYVTHWSLVPSETSFNVARLQMKAHPFEKIYFVAAHDIDSALVIRLYPVPLQTLAYLPNIKRFRENRIEKLSPDAARFEVKDGKATIMWKPTQ